jgi:LPS-assembly protein
LRRRNFRVTPADFAEKRASHYAVFLFAKMRPKAEKNAALTGVAALCFPSQRRAKFTIPRRRHAGRGVRALPMTSRTRFLITAALVCHLLFAPALVTSQLLSSSSQSGASQNPSNFPAAPAALKYQDVTVSAVTQEKKGPVFKLQGKAEIHYGAFVLHADEITYNSDTDDATVEGHVVLDGGPYDEHVEARRGTYNLRTETGRFESVNATIGTHIRGNRLLLTSSNPFAFSGRLVEKTGPNHYVVYDGIITTCELPRPNWEFRAHEVIVDAGGNAQIYRSSFLIRGIPIFYFPYATHPISRVRQSGFSIPNVGTSSTKGKIIGESLYWAMNRSMDLEAGAQYFSKRGWAPHGEFRARPSESSFVDVNYAAVFDRGFGPQGANQGGQEARLDAGTTFGHNFLAVANIDYLTSYVYRLAFNEVFTQAVNSEVKSVAFLTNTMRGSFYNLEAERYQNFESTNAGDVITIRHTPSLELSSVDRQINGSPFYWSYEAEVGGLSRSQPGFQTAAFVGRFDLNPTVSLPLVLAGWSVRPAISLHDTVYTQELRPPGGNGAAVSDAINRKALEGLVEVRPPSLERVFTHEFLGRKWKHVIEPRATYRYVTGVDNFSSILRFDSRDILSNTNEVEYAVVSRLYAKRTSANLEDCGQPGMPGLLVGEQLPQSRIPWERQTLPQEALCQTGPEVREVVTWELAQKYYLDPSFGDALVAGARNVFTATADLTGIAFLTDSRRFSPLISRLRIQTNARTDVEWDLDYDVKKGRMSASTALLNYRAGSFTVGAGDAFLQTPSELLPVPTTPTPQRFDQFRLLLGYGHSDKRGFSAAANIGFDTQVGFLQYASSQAAYNWNCCGINVEYRRFALGSVRNENQFRFTFALANIGALGNLRRQERLF